MDTDVRIGAIASGQLGLITLRQAETAGVSTKERRVRLRSGRWEPRQPGVYAIAGAPATWEQRVLAAVLAAGGGAVASHLTAGALHAYPDVVGDGIEITVRPGRQPRLHNVTVHRPRLLPDHDIRRVRGIPVTSFARTLVDCSGQLSLGQLARALDDGLLRHDLTLWSLERTLSKLKQAPGRHPSKLWTLLAERGSETALAESRPEMRLARLIRASGSLMPVQQHWVTIGGERFRLDFAYPDVLVALEYDGWDPHRTRAAFDRDRRRDRVLQSAGWRVFRFTSQTPDDEILAIISSVCASGAL